VGGSPSELAKRQDVAWPAEEYADAGTKAKSIPKRQHVWTHVRRMGRGMPLAGGGEVPFRLPAKPQSLAKHGLLYRAAAHYSTGNPFF
jgi:hypothetical protein